MCEPDCLLHLLNLLHKLHPMHLLCLLHLLQVGQSLCRCVRGKGEEEALLY